MPLTVAFGACGSFPSRSACESTTMERLTFTHIRQRMTKYQRTNRWAFLSNQGRGETIHPKREGLGIV